MTAEEYLKALRWVNDQYRMAIAIKEGYMDSMRDISDRVKTGKLTPEEGERLCREYEDMKSKLDRHLSEVREIESELDRIADGENIGNQRSFRP